MHLTHDGKFERSDIWREGKWLDLWSVVHFLTGISTGLGFSILGFDFLPSVIIAFLAFTAYEFWEARVKIRETPQNRVMDVVVGLASFVPTFLFVAPSLSFLELFLAFWGVLGVNLTISYFGWDTSHKADLIEAKMRLEIAHQREKFLRRRERFAANRERRRSLKKRLRARKLSPQLGVVAEQTQPHELEA